MRICAYRYLLTTSSPDRELSLKDSWSGESPSTATRQIIKQNEGWTRRLTWNPWVTGKSRPIEAAARDGQVDKRNRVRRLSAERNSVNLTEIFRDFPQLLGKSQDIRCKAGARPALPFMCAAASLKRLSNVALIQYATEPIWVRYTDSQPSKVYPSQSNLGSRFWHNQSSPSACLHNR